MFNCSPMQVHSRSGLLVLLSFIALTVGIGCMDDPLGPEIVARNIFRPSAIHYQFFDYNVAASTGNMRVMWSPASTDTQSNFKGYYIKLSTPRFDTLGTNVAVLPGDSLEAKHVPKSDTSVVFEDLRVDEIYVVQIWGEGFVQNADTLKLSRDFVQSHTLFDPRPVENPEILGVVALGRQNVLLVWAAPPEPRGKGFNIYFSDPSRSEEIGVFYTRVSSTTTSLNISVPPHADALATGFVEMEYKFWIKALGADSLENRLDSSVIKWSGADRLDTTSVTIGRSLGIGNDRGVYRAIEMEPSAGAILFTQVGNELVLTGQHETRFVNRVDNAKGVDSVLFTRPFDNSEFDQTQLSIPVTGSPNGVMVYGLLGEPAGGTRFRMFLQADSTGLITASNKVVVRVVSQRQKRLPYF